MVRNRPADRTVKKIIADKLIGTVLLASAIMIWLVIIIAISFLMIDSRRMKDALKNHAQVDEQTVEWRQYVREELQALKGQATTSENRIKNITKRLEKLEPKPE